MFFQPCLLLRRPLAGDSVWGALATPSSPAPASVTPGDDPRVVAHSRKAAQRHGACLPGLKHHRQVGRWPLRAGIQPTFLLSHFPISCQPSGHVLTSASLLSSHSDVEMTCPSSHVVSLADPAGRGGRVVPTGSSASPLPLPR